MGYLKQYINQAFLHLFIEPVDSEYVEYVTIEIEQFSLQWVYACMFNPQGPVILYNGVNLNIASAMLAVLWCNSNIFEFGHFVKGIIILFGLA